MEPLLTKARHPAPGQGAVRGRGRLDGHGRLRRGAVRPARRPQHDPRRDGHRPDRGRVPDPRLPARTRSAPAPTSSSSTRPAQSVELGRNDDYFGGPEAPRSARPRSTSRSSRTPRRRPPPSRRATSTGRPRSPPTPSRRSRPTRTSRSPSTPTSATTSSPSTSARVASTATRTCARRSRCASTTTRPSQAATEGNGVPVYANTPPASWAFNPDVPKYTLDVAGAKKLDRELRLDARQRRHLREGRQAPLLRDCTSAPAARSASPSASSPPTSSRSAASRSRSRKATSRPSSCRSSATRTTSTPTSAAGRPSVDPDDYSIFHSSKCATKENPDDNNFVVLAEPRGRQAPRGRPRGRSTRPSARTSTRSSR